MTPRVWVRVCSYGSAFMWIEINHKRLMYILNDGKWGLKEGEDVVESLLEKLEEDATLWRQV